MIQGGTGASKRRPLLKICSRAYLPLFKRVPPSPPVAHKRRNLSLCFFFCQRQNGGYRSRIGQMPGGETASGGEEQGICRNELKSISWHYEFFGPTPYKIIDNLCTNSPITTLPDCSLLSVDSRRRPLSCLFPLSPFGRRLPFPVTVRCPLACSLAASVATKLLHLFTSHSPTLLTSSPFLSMSFATLVALRLRNTASAAKGMTCLDHPQLDNASVWQQKR